MSGPGDPLISLRDFSLIRHTPEGDLTVLSGMDLDVHGGQWLVLLGGNGSGKSSLLKYLASNEAAGNVSAAIMFQDPDEQIIARTVGQEISLGREGVDPLAVAEEFSLEALGNLDPRLLSAGQKQRLVLAVALGGNPQILLCDEPVALQDEEQTHWVLDRLDSWRRDTGGALVTASQDLREARRADRIVVLQDGCIVLEGKPEEVLEHPTVLDLIGPLDMPPPTVRRVENPSATALELRGVGCDFLGPGGGFRGMDIALDPGARVGITGPNGCGKSTLLAVCAGLRRPESGTARLGGHLLYKKNNTDLDHGMALLAPQFPEYLFTRPTVEQEWGVDPRLAGLGIGGFLKKLGFPVEIARRNPHSLSSGQRRRLALGLILFSGRPLLLLDEPTAALDRQGKLQLLNLLQQVPESTAMVIASGDREFLEAAGCEIKPLAKNHLLP